MKKIFAAIGALALIASSASAADLAVLRKAPPRPIAVEDAYNWSGFSLWGYFSYAANLNNMATVIGSTATIDLASIPNGPGVGGAIDLMYQGGGSPWAVGIRGRMGYLDLSNGGALTTAGTQVLSVNNATNYLGSVVGELGYAIAPRVLPYVVGGFAFGGAHPNLAAAGICAGGRTAVACEQAITDTSVGYTVGAGIRYAVPNTVVQLFIEGDWTHLGDRQLTIPNPVAGLAPIATSNAKYGIIEQQVGAIIKFGPAS